MSEPNERGRVVSDEARARAMLEQLKGVHAIDIGRDMVIATVNFSYPKLGLTDETRAVRDLGDVRVSIELIRAILEVLEREHAGEKTSDLHDTLAQMQLAYAHAVQLANAERAAAAGEPDEPAAAAEQGAGEPDDAGADDAASAAADDASSTGVDEAPGAAGPQDEPAIEKSPAAGKKVTAKKKPAAKSRPVTKKRPAGDD